MHEKDKELNKKLEFDNLRLQRELN